MQKQNLETKVNSLFQIKVDIISQTYFKLKGTFIFVSKKKSSTKRFRKGQLLLKTAGGVPDSIGSVRGGLHVEDDRWPRKTSIKTIIANEEYALAA